MSERLRYPAGVPCWVETLQPDVDAALDFYGSLFGWTFVGNDPGAASRSDHYFVARVRGRDVAGVGSVSNEGGRSASAWITHVCVARADEAASRATNAGGTVREGPLDAMPAGRVAVLADPAGALICAWEPGSREGAQLVSEAQAWSLSVLRTDDQQGSRAFYGSVFGWESQDYALSSEVTLWRLPGYVGGRPRQPAPRDVVGLMTALGGPGSGGRKNAHWSVDFFVDDVGATVSKAVQLGGRAIVPPSDTPGSRTALLADPQGATFSVTAPADDDASRT